METQERRERNRVLALLTLGYTGYYLCGSNFSVAMPLLVEYLEAGGMTLDSARIALGGVASLGVFAYAFGKFASGPLNERFGARLDASSPWGRTSFCSLLGGCLAGSASA